MNSSGKENVSKYLSIDLEVLDLKCDNSHFPVVDEIDKLTDSISYNDFYWKYIKRNAPVVLTNVANDWLCSKQWIESKKDNNPKSINFNYLRNNIGNYDVPISNCSKVCFNNHERMDFRFHDFLDYWQNRINNESLKNGNDITDENLYYLKDWHLKSYMPSYFFYDVPKHFASDWLNEFLVENNEDDYRFVYMGPQTTWTPFHMDVFGSYSWSTNIVGQKKWVLLPPGEELKLCDRLGNLPFCVDEDLLKKNNIKFHSVIQLENEAVFIPSGWYHQVWNLSDTISINHNWFNACNIQYIWHILLQNMKKVVREIDDCRTMDNFEEQCQTILRANHGMNFKDFFKIIEYIVKSRCSVVGDCSNIIKSSNIVSFEKYSLNNYHIMHDLHTIKLLLEDIMKESVIFNSNNYYLKCKQIYDSII